MPTVSTRDFNGHWNEHKSVGEETVTTERFKEIHDLNMLPSTPTTTTDHIAEEHGYAITQRFISSNSYYGYHPVMTTGEVEDCSMDTSENAANAGSNPNNTCGRAEHGVEWLVSRKRCLDGTMEFDADTMSVSKRGRYDRDSETPLSCHPPLTSYQEPLKQQQLPGNTSYLMKSVMPRPRCLMGCYV